MKAILLTLIVVSLVATALFVPSEWRVVAPGKEETVKASTKEADVEVLLPELVPICTCESTGKKEGIPRHFDENGEVLKGKINPLDTGVCQINLYYHQEKAESMGLDLFKKNDNIRYANFLYKQKGSAPWSWSKSCWK